MSPEPDEPPDPDEDPNLRAVVLTVSYGALDFLMPADAESDVTAGLPLSPVKPAPRSEERSVEIDLDESSASLASARALLKKPVKRPGSIPPPA